MSGVLIRHSALQCLNPCSCLTNIFLVKASRRCFYDLRYCLQNVLSGTGRIKSNPVLKMHRVLISLTFARVFIIVTSLFYEAFCARLKRPYRSLWLDRSAADSQTHFRWIYEAAMSIFSAVILWWILNHSVVHIPGLISVLVMWFSLWIVFVMVQSSGHCAVV